MPHLKSAKKRHRQSEAANRRNRSVKSDLRTQMKKFLVAVKEGQLDQAAVELQLCYKKLDKCGVRRYLHPNTAHRYKGRLAARLNAAKQKAAEST